MPACIIDVVLPIHRVARCFQQVADCCAEGGMTAVTDMQWTSRIGRDEFKQNARLIPEFPPAVGCAPINNRFDLTMECCGAQVEIDKTGPGDFDIFNLIGRRKFSYNCGRQIAWVFPCGFCEPHCNVRCKVAVRGIPGALNRIDDRQLINSDCEIR